MVFDPVLKRSDDGSDYTDLEVYLERGGYQAAKKALKLSPADVQAEVKKASIRGRGGAGFPAGVKWGFVPKDSGKPIYLVINADEGEPGTFKDRHILEHEPHLLLEGCIIAAWALGVRTVFVYIRGEFVRGIRTVQKAIDDARAAGILFTPVPTKQAGGDFQVDIFVHPGAGAYICGEETALIESIEGKPGQPRLKPPFPAVVGLFGCPTVVNNVETIAACPTIIERGGDWWLEQGVPPKDGGRKLFCMSGHVKKPGVYEFGIGKNLKELIYEDCGGILDDRALKLVIPGGSSTPCLLPDEIDVAMSFDELPKVGSMLGSAGAVVVAEGTCTVALAFRLARFYAHESCGQCTPCREGTGWLERMLHRLEHGLGDEGDVDLILQICDQIEGNTICPLGDACAWPVRALAKKFRDEFEEHVKLGRCPFE